MSSINDGVLSYHSMDGESKAEVCRPAFTGAVVGRVPRTAVAAVGGGGTDVDAGGRT